ncbi:MAG: hypothetical protein AABW86_03205, partial [Candidatus Micrarchaeota archaeon]
LTEYHRLADKGSDEAVRLERAVLEDISKISGDKLNPKIMDEEGARLLVERGEELSSPTEFLQFRKRHEKDADTITAFIKAHSREIYDIDNASKKLGLSNYAKLGENRDKILGMPRTQ